MIYYDLLLYRAAQSARGEYVGRASGKKEAKAWAEKRLKRDDIHYGDKIEAVPTGGDAKPFTVD